MNDLIVVKQLPIIEERLKEVSAEIETELNRATSLACTEDTYKEVKKVRAELNKKFNDIEAERKKVKAAIAAPYRDFEAVYNEYIGDKFKNADNVLKSKIYTIQDDLIKEKREHLKEYFNEYLQSLHMDFVTLQDTGVTVTMSASLRSLKSQVKMYLDGVAEDVAMINTLPDAPEIMVEFKKDLNAARSVTAVEERKKAIAAEKQAAEDVAPIIEAEQVAEEKVEAVTPPTVKEEKTVEQEYLMTFKVTATMEKLKALKAFLVEGGYKYE